MAALLALMVALTFAYKDMRFGGDRLSNAFVRSVGRGLSEAWYGIVFGGPRMIASAFSIFGGEREGARAVPVLLYHTITDRPGAESVPPEQFAAHMQALAAAGWRTVRLHELERFLRGEGELPAKSFVLTFDDGAKESFYPVDPVLSSLGFTAIEFVIPKYSDRAGTHYYLAEGEIRSMIETGRWEIGSHTYDSHHLAAVDQEGHVAPVLANRLYLSDKERIETVAEYRTRIEDDISRAKKALQETYGVSIPSFAFPFGEFGQLSQNYPESLETIAAVAGKYHSIGFYQTWTGEGFSQNYPSSGTRGMILAKRLEPRADLSPDDLVALLVRGEPKNIPYEDDFTKDQGWFSVWGTYRIENGALSMRALPDETGAGVVLDGSRDWKNYRVTATVSSPAQTGVFLWARFTGNNDNAGCNFGNGFLHAEQIVDGARRVVKGTRSPAIAIPSGRFTIEARIKGRTLTCILNGTHTITTEFLDPSLSEGGIGIKIWDRKPETASVTVHALSVEPLP